MQRRPTAAPSDEEKLRAARAIGALVLVLWAAAIVRPAQAYPFAGVVWTSLLAILCVLGGWLVTLTRAKARVTPPLALGISFVAWAWARWALGGFHPLGVENVVTFFTWAAWFFVAATTACFFVEANTSPDGDRQRAVEKLSLWALGALAVLATAFAWHALLQYTVLYDQALARLRQEIGSRPPTPLELGLMHHFRLKRVASVWGDPNAFGCFCAMGLVGWWSLWRTSRQSRLSRLVAACAATGAVACAVGIVLSGSRGAVVDTLVAGVAIWAFGKRSRGARVTASILLLVALGAIRDKGVAADTGSPPSSPPVRSWFQRSDTIRERLHYAEVGWQLWCRSPWIGSGVGGVEMAYGRLKPPAARETKYLHNWFLQIAAELGIVGLLVYGAFLAAVARSVLLCRLAPVPVQQAFLALFVLFLVDSSIQLSFNERELMMTFAALCGLAVATRASEPVQGAPETTRWGPLLLAGGMLLAGALSILAIPRGLGAGYAQIAKDALEVDDLTAAQTALKRALHWQPRDPNMWSLQAALAARRGELAQAETATRRALAFYPESASLHAQLADLALRRNNLLDAERFARAAIERYPTKAEYWRLLARVLEREGRLQEASAAAKRAMAFNQDDKETDRALVARIERQLRQASPHRETTTTEPLQ